MTPTMSMSSHACNLNNANDAIIFTTAKNSGQDLQEKPLSRMNAAGGMELGPKIPSVVGACSHLNNVPAPGRYREPAFAGSLVRRKRRVASQSNGGAMMLSPIANSGRSCPAAPIAA